VHNFVRNDLLILLVVLIQFEGGSEMKCDDVLEAELMKQTGLLSMRAR